MRPHYTGQAERHAAKRDEANQRMRRILGNGRKLGVRQWRRLCHYKRRRNHHIYMLVKFTARALNLTD